MPSKAGRICTDVQQLLQRLSTTVGLAKWTPINVRRRVDIRVDAHVLLRVACARMHQVATPHEYVANFEGQEMGAAITAIGEEPQARAALDG